MKTPPRRVKERKERKVLKRIRIYDKIKIRKKVGIKNMNNIIILDTETLGVKDRRVYQIGYIIYDLDNNTTLKTRDYVIRQVFDNEDLMKSAYYSNKLKFYKEKIELKEILKLYLQSALNVLKRDLDRYGINKVYAYNCNFDKSAIQITCDYYNKENVLDKCDIRDIMKLAQKQITANQDYIDWCEINNQKTPKGKNKQTAEAVYRYLKNDLDFIENHTALQDCEIEKDILLHCLSLAE